MQVFFKNEVHRPRLLSIDKYEDNATALPDRLRRDLPYSLDAAEFSERFHEFVIPETDTSTDAANEFQERWGCFHFWFLFCFCFETNWVEQFDNIWEGFHYVCGGGNH